MKYAVITGASSGLGREFARQLSKEYKLILIARRFNRLEELKKELNTECVLLNYDLSIEANCFKVVEILKKYPIEVFINNAGFGKAGYFRDIDIHEELNMMDVNMRACHIFLKAMVQRNCRYILNVTSSAGLLPAGPLLSTYYASKAYMTSLTRAVAMENPDLYIGCLCPGPVATEFDSRANVQFSLKGLDPAYCVDYALKQMKKNKKVIIPTFTMKGAIFFGRFIPQNTLIKMTMHQQKKKI